MVERVFLIFDGADAGRTFVLGGDPVEIGREPGRDVALNDDRASRLHARLVPEGDRVMLHDENSSNGTFVNGVLTSACELHQGDVIQIGGTKIVFGREPPPSGSATGRRAVSPAGRERVRRGGTPTEILSEEAAAVPIHPVEVLLSGILEAAAAASQEAAAARGIHISVELELASERVSVDPQQLHKALVELLANLPASQTETVPASETSLEVTVALRADQDLDRGGFKIEVIWIGGPIAREEVQSSEQRGAFRVARGIVAAHGGILELVPTDSADTLARVRLPFGSAGASRETVLR